MHIIIIMYQNSAPAVLLLYTVTVLCINVQSSATGSTGDVKSAKTQFYLSIACTLTGWIFSLVGIVTIIASVISVVVIKSYSNSSME